MVEQQLQCMPGHRKQRGQGSPCLGATVLLNVLNRLKVPTLTRKTSLGEAQDALLGVLCCVQMQTHTPGAIWPVCAVPVALFISALPP